MVIQEHGAWNRLHEFLNVAKGTVLKDTGKGWYMDLHGHGHSIQRLELGYQLSGCQLDLADAALDGSKAYEDTSSVKTMSEGNTRYSFSALLQGSTSLGTLYANNGFPSIPSSSDPGPKEIPTFAVATTPLGTPVELRPPAWVGAPVGISAGCRSRPITSVCGTTPPT